MGYVTLSGDGASPVASITGYRVVWTANGRQKQSRPFPLLKNALGFQQRIRMGQTSTIVPVYGKRQQRNG
jgi:hypothetical protein